MKCICFIVAALSKFFLDSHYLHNQFAQVCINYFLFLLDSNLKLLHSYSDKEDKTANVIKLLKRLDYAFFKQTSGNSNKQTVYISLMHSCHRL